MKILKYIALGLVVALSSCSDYLEESNPNMSDKDTYWTNLNQTNSTLTAAYAAMVSDFALNIAYEAPRTDLATPGFGRPTYTGEGAVWYTHSYDNSNNGVIKKWEILYMGIFRANQVIEALHNMENVSSEEAWTVQMAQARFLRGLYHFYLHSTYNRGSIIIKDKVPGNLEDFNQSLSTSEEVVEFFRKDLQYAYNNLPEVYADSKDQGRATKGAAAAMLGTSYLYQGTLPGPGNIDMVEIDSAITKFEYIIGSKNYELVDDMALLFTTAGEMNKESIFEIAFSNTVNPEYSTWVEDNVSNRLAFTFDGRGSNSSNVFPSLWVTNAYVNEKMDPLDSRNMVEEPEDPGVFVPRPVSLRTSAMIGVVQDEFTKYYDGLVHNAVSFPSNDKRTQNGFSRYKIFNNHDILDREQDNPGGNQRSGKNVTLSRLGDIYMMLAECYIYKNDVTEALRNINMVRQRWALELIGPSNGDASHTYNEVNYDATTLLTRLQNVEKPLETSIEGHCIRWFDLRRWGILKSNFDMHANETFWSAHYTVTRGENARTKWHSTITDTDPNDPTLILLKDYEQAALNFNYQKHAWLPIPSTETVTNTDIFN
ncbi:RagB/SusD family nutrient uptake outer membrane protein [Labilibacter marinus]|uniref:RagB/SusD family nutrient uptake outer membrane protein n=1 Tax=Labilibacter marinus TaxID=1477105 RepID=UPI00082F3915|nr:RagB/SusD family nutrient uptake outer membrane protein [Labilibacter marinus]